MSALTSPRELGALFLKLGVIGFGGPAAHIALMRREVVQERQWFTDQEFLEMAAVTNLIPGPNSTEMAMHIGSRRGGLRGLVISGATFIVPAVIIVAFISWLYAEYGTSPWVFDIRYGILPVIIAIVAHAVLMLTKSIIKENTYPHEKPDDSQKEKPTDIPSGGRRLTEYLTGRWRLTNHITGKWRPTHHLTGARRLTHQLGKEFSRARLLGMIQGLSLPFLATVLYLFGLNELIILLFSGLITLTLKNNHMRRMFAPVLPVFPLLAAVVRIDLSSLGLLFLKIGSVLYGSGYVLIAFLDRELVENRGLLTAQQLLDAVAVGQITPGPVFSTATFIGWQLHGVSGAVVATLAIFAPSFFFVGFLSRILPWIKKHPGANAFLVGVTASSLGLMTGALVRLASGALTDTLTWGIGLAALLLLVRTKISSVALIFFGVIIGLGQSLVNF